CFLFLLSFPSCLSAFVALRRESGTRSASACGRAIFCVAFGLLAGRREAAMRRIALTVLIVLLFGVTVVRAASGAQDVARGEKVYAEQKCGICHSIADKGNKKGPLDGVGSKLSLDEIRAWMTDAKAMT